MVKHVNLGRKPAKPTSHKMRVLWLLILTVGILSAAGWMFAQPEAAAAAARSGRVAKHPDSLSTAI